MAQSLMKEADDLGILDLGAKAAEENVYTDALKKIEAEVAKVQTSGDAAEGSKGDAGAEEELGDALLEKMMRDDSAYAREYSEVIEAISGICSALLAN